MENIDKEELLKRLTTVINEDLDEIANVAVVMTDVNGVRFTISAGINLHELVGNIDVLRTKLILRIIKADALESLEEESNDSIAD